MEKQIILLPLKHPHLFEKISAQPHTLIMHADVLIMYALHCF